MAGFSEETCHLSLTLCLDRGAGSSSTTPAPGRVSQLWIMEACLCPQPCCEILALGKRDCDQTGEAGLGGRWVRGLGREREPVSTEPLSKGEEAEWWRRSKSRTTLRLFRASTPPSTAGPGTRSPFLGMWNQET